MPVVELEKGKTYKYCTCGYSKKMPFCDQSHVIKGGGKPIVFIAETSGSKALCGCGKSQNKPYCDGSHNN